MTFGLDGGHAWINYAAYSVLNYAWILDPVYNNVIMFRGLEKEGPTLVSLCILIFFIFCLAINIYLVHFSTSSFLRGRLDLPALALSQLHVRREPIR